MCAFITCLTSFAQQVMGSLLSREESISKKPRPDSTLTLKRFNKSSIDRNFVPLLMRTSQAVRLGIEPNMLFRVYMLFFAYSPCTSTMWLNELLTKPTNMTPCVTQLVRQAPRLNNVFTKRLPRTFESVQPNLDVVYCWVIATSLASWDCWV